MDRARLKNMYLKNPNTESKLAYTRHKNFCTNLLKREKRNYYNNLDTKIFKNNKTFWERVKPLFSEKSMIKHNIRLNENGITITDKKEVAEILNNYFLDSVENLEVERHLPKISFDDENKDYIEEIVEKFKNHPSIIKIKENVKYDETFDFKDSTIDKMYKRLISRDPSKGCMKSDIPTKIILGASDIISKPLNSIYNKAKNSEQFPKTLKTADVTPLPKDREKDNKKKYRPVSLTPTFSKIFEKDMYDQILEFTNRILSQFVFGYREGHSLGLCVTTNDRNVAQSFR